MLKAYKYRIYPTQEQSEQLSQQFGNARYVFNWGLAEKIKEYQENKKTISCFSLMNRLPKMKKEIEWLKLSDAQVLQQSLRRLDNAFTSFFRKQNKFPHFKTKRDKQSMTYPQRVKIEEERIYLPKIGWMVKPEKRDFEGKIKNVTVSMTTTNKYFASVLVENGVELPKKQKITEQRTIGIDVGLTHFLTTSKSEKIENPRYLKNALIRLKVKQKQFSRKKKGSIKRNKARLNVALIHEKVVNKRSDFVHKLSKRLISENQAIAIEDLFISGMIKNHSLAFSISDVAWREFFDCLSYKADWYGKTILKIGRFEASSKICNKCGFVNNKLTLSDRTWKCKCGIEHDRDINASINIKKFALLGLQDSEPRINKIALSGQQ
jgi:putative transposase